ncbi:hypothetical protein [Acinetobacter calcoaceticus]
MNIIKDLKEKITYLEESVKKLKESEQYMMCDEQAYLVRSEIFMTNDLIDKLNERKEFEEEYFKALKGEG